MQKYSGHIMYPPRPSRSVPPAKLQDYEDKGYVGQYKYNGTRTLVEIGPGSKISLWTRHKEPHKAYKLSDGMKEELTTYHQQGDTSKTIVLDGELLNDKTKSVKDRLVLFDVLVIDSDYLIGTSMLERKEILDETFWNSDRWENDTGRKMAVKPKVFDKHGKERYLDHVWVAETFFYDLSKRYEELIDMDEIEGLVLKNPRALLENGFSENNNSEWLIRCRKETKSYKY